MMCSHCEGDLKVTHTYTVKDVRYARAVCDDCGKVHRLDTFVSPVDARGQGAKAHAARAKKADA